MANKLPLADEFEKTLNELDSELDNIQKCAQEIFQKVDNSFSYPYPIGSVSNELNVLLLAIQHFERKAKNSGVTTTSTAASTAVSAAVSADIKPINESGRLNVMVEEKKIVVDTLNQESKRITDNAKAALSG